MASEDRKEDTASDGEFVVIKLTKPIKAHGETLEEIKCRAPTAADIIQIGNPVIYEFMIDGRPRITYDDGRMARMISLLGGVPPSSVAQMSPREFVSACWIMRDFFLPA
jgi:hypothetical protein